MVSADYFATSIFHYSFNFNPPPNPFQSFRTTLIVESAYIKGWLFTRLALAESLNRGKFGAKESLLTSVSLRHINFIFSLGPIPFTRARILLCFVRAR